MVRIGKVEPSGRTVIWLDSSPLGFNFPDPHHDPVKDSLFVWRLSVRLSFRLSVR